MRAAPLVRACAGGLGAWAVVRAAGLERGGPLVVPLSFTPHTLPLGAAVTAIAARLRLTGSAVVAAASTLALAGAVLPRVVRQPAPPAGGPLVPLRLGVANLYVGRADAGSVVSLVRDERVDVLVTPELTPPAVARLQAAGLGHVLPHHVLAAAFGGSGNGVWSRWPLRQFGELGGSPVGPWVSVGVPGAAAVEVVAVHPPPPRLDHLLSGQWAAGLRALPAPNVGVCRLVAGDLNATLDHAVTREVLARGWVDAAAALGAGLRATWGPLPWRRWAPALVAIDHVLVDARTTVHGLVVRGLPGSDHRALVADLRVPPAP